MTLLLFRMSCQSFLISGSKYQTFLHLAGRVGDKTQEATKWIYDRTDTLFYHGRQLILKKETEPFKKVFFFASKETPFFLMTPPDNPGAEFIKIVAATIFTIVLTVPGRS